MKNAFRWIGGLGLLPMLLSSTLAEDWAKIAAETDEPGFAMQIEEIVPGSQAETIGLKKGDFIYQFGDRSTRGLRRWRRDADEMLFYCHRGGKKGTAIVKSGMLGVGFVEVFRPQIEYLRGEIGTPDPKWDAAAASSLALLERNPKGALEAWAKTRALGYPADELDAFVRAYCAWRLAGTFPVREAFSKIHEEFSVMPHFYAAFLEDMAYASGQTDLLKKLRELDASSCEIPERQIESWNLFDASPPPVRRLAGIAKERRGPDVVARLTACEGNDHDKWAERLDRIRAHDSFHSDPGRYSLTKFRLPDDVRDFHYSISVHLYQHGFHDQYAGGTRIAAFVGSDDGKRLGGTTLAEIGVYGNRHAGTLIAARAGYGSTNRDYRRFDKRIPVKGQEKEGEQPHMSVAFNLDLIRLGREVAVYCDGVCYGHMPIDPAAGTAELHFYNSGMETKIKRLEIWSINPEKPVTKP